MTVKLTEKNINISVWAMCGLLLVLAFTAWGQSLSWDMSGISGYQLFPLLGLIAFNLMLSHYLSGVVRRLAGVPKSALRRYFKITSQAVLIAILLHPAILAWNLFHNGLGLPPESFFDYVSDDRKIWILFGLLGFTVFIAFEFKELWKSQKVIEWMSDIAMFAILLHALFLGSRLQDGWYRWLWYVYGLLFTGSLIFNRLYDKKLKASSEVLT